MSERSNTPDRQLRVPITIIAGFLGSGKTTLLNHLLQEEHGLRIAVMVNDFGEINIDASLLNEITDDEVISLPNGCICCTLGSSLILSFEKLLSTQTRPEHIIIEASGVSSPEDVVALIENSPLAKSVVVDTVITIVDPEKVETLSKVVIFIEKQINAADLVLVNKTDLVTKERLAEVMVWLQHIAPEARFLQTAYGKVPLDLLIGAHARQPVPKTHSEASPHHDHKHHEHHAEHDNHNDHGDHTDHDEIFERWMFTSQVPLLKSALDGMIAALPANIFRVKGFLYLIDNPDERMLLQIVGKRTRISGLGTWDDAVPGTSLVFIGEPGALNMAEVEAILTGGG